MISRGRKRATTLYHAEDRYFIINVRANARQKHGKTWTASHLHHLLLLLQHPLPASVPRRFPRADDLARASVGRGNKGAARYRTSLNLKLKLISLPREVAAAKTRVFTFASLSSDSYSFSQNQLSNSSFHDKRKNFINLLFKNLIFNKHKKLLFNILNYLSGIHCLFFTRFFQNTLYYAIQIINK